MKKNETLSTLASLVFASFAALAIMSCTPAADPGGGGTAPSTPSGLAVSGTPIPSPVSLTWSAVSGGQRGMSPACWAETGATTQAVYG